MIKFLKIDKEGVWFDALFVDPHPTKPRGGKIILKLEDFSKLGYEILDSKIEDTRFNDLIEKGVFKVHSLQNY